MGKPLDCCCHINGVIEHCDKTVTLPVYRDYCHFTELDDENWITGLLR